MSSWVTENGDLYSSLFPESSKHRTIQAIRWPAGWGGHDEIMAIVKELEKAEVIRPAQSPFISLVWPIKKSNGTW